MATPKELRASIVENRARLHEALHGAHAKWTVKPAGADGEDAWSPSEVAKHAIGSERYFTNLVCKACGAPELERPELDASTPGKTAAGLSNVGAADDNMLRHVSDADLGKTLETPFGTRSVEELLNTMIVHTAEHVTQIEAASA